MGDVEAIALTSARRPKGHLAATQGVPGPGKGGAFRVVGFMARPATTIVPSAGP